MKYLGMVLGLASVGAQAGIEPAAEVFCRGEDAVEVELALFHAEAHPMAGASFFGMAKFRQAQVEWVVAVEGYADATEWGVVGTSVNPANDRERQDYRLSFANAWDSTRTTKAQLEVITRSVSPFGEPKGERLELECGARRTLDRAL